MSTEIKNINNTKAKAANAIAVILRDLEIETGCYVENIDIQSTEITTYEDAGPQFRMSVFIGLKRPPGTHWE